MKRLMTRARGSGSRILKRSSHIRIILTDEIEIKTRDKKKGGKKPGGKKKAYTKSPKVTKENKAPEEPKAEAKE
jgi:large subunit ribosomal protein L22